MKKRVPSFLKSETLSIWYCHGTLKQQVAKYDDKKIFYTLKFVSVEEETSTEEEVVKFIFLHITEERVFKNENTRMFLNKVKEIDKKFEKHNEQEHLLIKIIGLPQKSELDFTWFKDPQIILNPKFRKSKFEIKYQKMKSVQENLFLKGFFDHTQINEWISLTEMRREMKSQLKKVMRPYIEVNSLVGNELENFVFNFLRDKNIKVEKWHNEEAADLFFSITNNREKFWIVCEIKSYKDNAIKKLPFSQVWEWRDVFIEKYPETAEDKIILLVIINNQTSVPFEKQKELIIPNNLKKWMVGKYKIKVITVWHLIKILNSNNGVEKFFKKILSTSTKALLKADKT